MNDQPPAIISPASLTIQQQSTKTILTVTPDGKILRNGTPINFIPKEEALKVIRELVDVMQRR